MNRNRRSLEANIRKKMNKKIKEAQSIYFVKEPINQDVSLKDELKKYRRKISKTNKNPINPMEKEMDIKKKKLHSVHHSKRTTPGELLEQNAAPAIVHKESARWNKTLVSQNVVKGKSLTKKINKRNSK